MRLAALHPHRNGRSRGLAVLALGLAAACSGERGDLPESLDAARSAEQVRGDLACSGVYDLLEAGYEFRVVVCPVGVDEYRIQAYRRGGDTFLRHGPRFEYLGFSEPAPSPFAGGRIRTVHLATGSAEQLALTAETADFQLEEGEWVPVPRTGR